MDSLSASRCEFDEARQKAGQGLASSGWGDEKRILALPDRSNDRKLMAARRPTFGAEPGGKGCGQHRFQVHFIHDGPGWRALTGLTTTVTSPRLRPRFPRHGDRPSEDNTPACAGDRHTHHAVECVGAADRRRQYGGDRTIA